MNVPYDIEERLAPLPVQEAWVGVVFGPMAVRFGPYPPAAVGGFLTRLMAATEGPHPFFFTIQCEPVDDPVPHLIELARPDPEDEAKMEEAER